MVTTPAWAGDTWGAHAGAPASLLPAVSQPSPQNFWTFHSTCFSHPETWPREHMESNSLTAGENGNICPGYLQTTFCGLAGKH